MIPHNRNYDFIYPAAITHRPIFPPFHRFGIAELVRDYPRGAAGSRWIAEIRNDDLPTACDLQR